MTTMIMMMVVKVIHHQYQHYVMLLLVNFPMKKNKKQNQNELCDIDMYGHSYNDIILTLDAVIIKTASGVSTRTLLFVQIPDTCTMGQVLFVFVHEQVRTCTTYWYPFTVSFSFQLVFFF